MLQTQQAELQNISVNNFESTYSARTTIKGSIIQNDYGTFKVSQFACLQFLKAFAFNVASSPSPNITASIPTNIVQLIALLGIKAGQPNPDFEFSLIRKEVVWLRDILELRMKHCEKERDDRSESFNADTYIGQKMLLLDLREWLLGAIVED